MDKTLLDGGGGGSRSLIPSFHPMFTLKIWMIFDHRRIWYCRKA